MSVNIFMPGPPECPLCYKQMKEIIMRKGTIYACMDKDCMISIRKTDPACGRWRDSEERMPPCPKHGTPMRAFFRIQDGFKKIQCPKCRAEGKISQVMVGKVEDMPPNQQQAWSVDPEEL